MSLNICANQLGDVDFEGVAVLANGEGPQGSAGGTAGNRAGEREARAVTGAVQGGSARDDGTALMGTARIERVVRVAGGVRDQQRAPQRGSADGYGAIVIGERRVVGEIQSDGLRAAGGGIAGAAIGATNTKVTKSTERAAVGAGAKKFTTSLFHLPFRSDCFCQQQGKVVVEQLAAMVTDHFVFEGLKHGGQGLVALLHDMA